MWSGLSSSGGGAPPPPQWPPAINALPPHLIPAQQQQTPSGAQGPVTGGGATITTNQQAQQQKHDIFVGNLAFSTTEEHLHQAFSDLGRIIKIRMVTDLETGKPRGFAFIEFEDPQAALSAIRNMNDHELNGRRIRVNFSNSSHLETLAGKLGMDMSQSSGGAAGGGAAKKGNMVGGVAIPSTDMGANATDATMAANQGTKAVAEALKSLTKGEMYDILKKLKEVADSDPDEARKIISGHPQLPEAILFLMSKLDMIKTSSSSATGGAGDAMVGMVPTVGAAGDAIPPPPAVLGGNTARVDPRAASKAAASTTSAAAARPADPRARADPRAAARQAAAPAAVSQPPPPPPSTAGAPPPGAFGAPPPPPPPGAFGAPPPPGTGGGLLPPPPPSAGGGAGVTPAVAGLDPKLVQDIMGLTPAQIALLPPEKQQGILALRQQITNSR